MRDHRSFATGAGGFPKRKPADRHQILSGQGGTSLPVSYLPFPFKGRPEITRVFELQLPQSLPCFLKTLSRASPVTHVLPVSNQPQTPKCPSASSPGPKIAEYLRLWLNPIRGLPNRFDQSLGKTKTNEPGRKKGGGGGWANRKSRLVPMWRRKRPNSSGGTRGILSSNRGVDYGSGRSQFGTFEGR